MSVRLIDRSDRDTFIQSVVSNKPRLGPEDVRMILAVVRGDPRLSDAKVYDQEDIEQSLAILDDNFRGVDLSQFGIEDPDTVRKEFLTTVAERHIDRLGLDIDVAELVSNLSEAQSSPSDDSTRSDIDDNIDQQGFDDDVDVDISESDVAGVVDTGHESESRATTADNVDSTEVTAATSDRDSTTVDGTAETSESAATESDNLLTWNDIDIEVPEFEDSEDVFGPFGQEVHRRLHRWDEDDVEFMIENRAGIRDLILEGSDEETILGIVSFLRLSLVRPSEIRPYIDTIELLSEYDELWIHLISQTILNQLTRYDPGTVLGHLDLIVDALSHNNVNVRGMAFDTLERFSREHAQHFSSGQVSSVASGLNEEIPEVKGDAALILKRVADTSPDLVSPYAGALVELTFEGEVSRLAGLDALRTLSGANPASINPYLSDLVECYEDLDSDEMYFWLDTMIPISREYPALDDYTDLIVEQITTDGTEPRTMALCILSNIASRNPGAVKSHLDTLQTALKISKANSESQPLNELLKIYAIIGSDNPEALLDQLDDIVDVYGQERVFDYYVTVILQTLAEERPEVAVEFIDIIGEELASDVDSELDEKVRSNAVFMLGYVSSDFPTEVSEYAEPAINIATQEKGQVAVAAGDLASNIASTDVDHIKANVDAIVGRISEISQPYQQGEGQILAHLGTCLFKLSTDNPSALTPHLETLVETIRERPDEPSQFVLEAVYGIANEQPEAVADYIDSIVELVSVDNNEIRMVVSMILAEVADEDVLIENLASIEDLFDADDDVSAMGALMVFETLLPEHPDAVDNSLEAVVKQLESNSHEVQQAAADLLEQYARERPMRLTPYLDELVETLPSPHSECNRDILLVLRQIAAEQPEVVEDYVPILNKQLAADSPEVVMATCFALNQCAATFPDQVANGITHLISILDDDREIEEKVAALSVLQSLAATDYKRLSGHTGHADTIAKFLDSDREGLADYAADTLVMMAISDSDAVTEHIDSIISVLQSGERFEELSLFFLTIGESVPEKTAERLDHVEEQLARAPSSDDIHLDTKAAWLSVLYRVGRTSPEKVAPMLDTVDRSLQPDAPDAERGVGAKVMGVVSKGDPAAVEPYADSLASVIEDGVDEGITPSVDALDNIGRYNRRSVAEYVELLEDLTPTNEEQAELIDRALKTLRGETVDDDDDDDDTLPYEATVFEDLDVDDGTMFEADQISGSGTDISDRVDS